MMLFVDTWGWVTLRDKRESKHSEAFDFYAEFRQRDGTVVTTDYVLDETFTILFKRLPFSPARESADLLQEAVTRGVVKIEWITPERFDKALGLRRRFQDKPDISFTDLSPMVVMEELGISRILTEDAHFAHVGMGFQNVP